MEAIDVSQMVLIPFFVISKKSNTGENTCLVKLKLLWQTFG